MVTVLKKFANNYNWVGITVVICLTVIGLMNLGNADYYSFERLYDTQIINFLIAYAVAIMIAFIDYIFYRHVAYFIYGIFLALLILVPIIGTTVSGSTRWIRFASFNFQPSEFIKLGIVFVLAKYFSDQKSPERYSLKSLWKPFLFILIPALLILMQPDLGTSLAFLFVGFTMIFYEGIKLRSFLLLVGIILLIIPVSWQYNIIQEYQKDRIILWLDPDHFKYSKENKDKMDKNLQPQQALWAVGSGQSFGKGGKKGTQSRLKALPEIHTDFILALYAEERGFVGCAILLSLYYLLCIWAFYIASKAKDKFGVLVAVGMGAIIFWHVFINVGMVTGLIPVVGIPLPFLSYGGSSILAVFICVGILYNISFTNPS